jgi:hypothetical protein
MLDELCDRVVAYLGKRNTCILSTTGPEGARAMPVRYRNFELEIECLLPRWADVAYDLQEDPRVMLIVQDVSAPKLRWLQCVGTAHPVEQPDWTASLPEETPTAPPDDLYLVVRVTPRRIDLLDESLGWGVRETLDL